MPLYVATRRYMLKPGQDTTSGAQRVGSLRDKGTRAPYVDLDVAAQTRNSGEASSSGPASKLRDSLEFREERMRLIPLGGLQQASDVAGVVGFSVSDSSDYVNGTIRYHGGCIVGAGSAPK
ncbi:MAG: hypothetical protein OXJ37_16765 [Bryobacterales bacterium]|nr:hypothetical protein [Bryobacterales bacterium]MDE0264058.1 hypothetical protein [Bryobacterales bacterium]MDE0620239.1 hypothetical protein [Bryobacterales bacterium]